MLNIIGVMMLNTLKWLHLIMLLNECDLLTVVDKMYWPSAAITFEYDNKLMLNSYVESGYKAAIINDDNKHAIDLFLAHINNVLACEREQRI